MKIGVFDSGVGGLTVFKYLEEVLPVYDYVYLGDNLRAPYGGRDDQTIYEFTRQAVDYLFKTQNCQLIVLACNTASASALRRLQQEYLPTLNDPHKRILGIIIPIAEAIPRFSKKGKIALIGTKATVHASAYDEEITKAWQVLRPSEKMVLYKEAAPLFVPLVEEGLLKNRATKFLARQYLRPLKKYRPDILLLACTHYPLLADLLAGIMGKSCRTILPGPIVAASLSEYLQRHTEIDALLSKGASRQFLCTAPPQAFNSLSSRFLGYSVVAEQVGLS
jgi:glutamate racemase